MSQAYTTIDEWEEFSGAFAQFSLPDSFLTHYKTID
jgi:hypothetical protein